MSGLNVAIARSRKTADIIRPTEMNLWYVFFPPPIEKSPHFLWKRSLASSAGSSSLVIDHVFLEFSHLGSAGEPFNGKDFWWRCLVREKTCEFSQLWGEGWNIWMVVVASVTPTLKLTYSSWKMGENSGSSEIPKLETILFRGRTYVSFREGALQGTNIFPQNGILKMIFLFARWDMLIPWRVRSSFLKPIPPKFGSPKSIDPNLAASIFSNKTHSPREFLFHRKKGGRVF